MLWTAKSTCRPILTCGLLAALVTACVTGVGPIDPDPDEVEVEWRGTLPVGGLAEIKGVNGRIEIERATGEETVIAFTKRGRDRDQVRIVAVEHADGAGVTICAVYPSVPGERENRCGVGEDGHSRTGDTDAAVDFFIQLPAGVDITANTVNGGIDGADLASDVIAATVNGNIQLTTSELAAAATVNGQIDVEMAGVIDRDLGYATVNGAITLVVRANSDADYTASTVNGTLTILGATIDLGGALSASGTIGVGGPLLSLVTVNGDITLNQLP